MRKLARLLFKLSAAALVALWWSGLSPEQGDAQEGLLDFQQFTCPSARPIGDLECCAILDTIYVPRKPK